jgi:hypothetical protein
MTERVAQRVSIISECCSNLASLLLAAWSQAPGQPHPAADPLSCQVEVVHDLDHDSDVARLLVSADVSGPLLDFPKMAGPRMKLSVKALVSFSRTVCLSFDGATPG